MLSFDIRLQLFDVDNIHKGTQSSAVVNIGIHSE
jgi:hypothetical protein